MTALILLAGGKGERMGAKAPKVFLPLGDKPIILHSFTLLKKFVEQIVVVCEKKHRHLFQGALFADPGIRRQDSVMNGFAKLTPCKRVLIHDGARPFVTEEAVTRLLATKEKAATLAVPVVNTIKKACTNGKVEKTLPRDTLWNVQTPQLLAYEILKKAKTITHDVTDDVAFAEALGYTVQLIEGEETNIKITHPLDLKIAEELCAIS